MKCHKDSSGVCDGECMRYIPASAENNIPAQCMDNVATQFLTKLCHLGIDQLTAMVQKGMKNG